MHVYIMSERPSLIAGLDCGLDCWTGLLDWINGSNQTAIKNNDSSLDLLELTLETS